MNARWRHLLVRGGYSALLAGFLLTVWMGAVESSRRWEDRILLFPIPVEQRTTFSLACLLGGICFLLAGAATIHVAERLHCTDLMPGRKIGRRLCPDRRPRTVYQDGDGGQYVRDETGWRVYGVWLLTEEVPENAPLVAEDGGDVE